MDLSNGSLLSLVTGYQKNMIFENLVEKPNNPDFLTYYKIVCKIQNLLEKLRQI